MGYEKMYEDSDSVNPVQTKQRLVLTQLEMSLVDARASPTISFVASVLLLLSTTSWIL